VGSLLLPVLRYRWIQLTPRPSLMQDALSRLGRVSFPLSLFAYPFYLLNRSPGKVGSHFDPKCNLFTPAEGKLVSS
jgi:acyl-lipid omega-3 desaturase